MVRKFNEYIEEYEIIWNASKLDEGFWDTAKHVGKLAATGADAAISGAGTAAKQTLRSLGNTAGGLARTGYGAIGSMMGPQDSRNFARDQLVKGLKQTGKGLVQGAGIVPSALTRAADVAGSGPSFGMQPGGSFGQMMGVRRAYTPEEEASIAIFKDQSPDEIKYNIELFLQNVKAGKVKLPQKEIDFRVRCAKEAMRRAKGNSGSEPLSLTPPQEEWLAKLMTYKPDAIQKWVDDGIKNATTPEEKLDALFHARLAKEALRRLQVGEPPQEQSQEPTQPESPAAPAISPARQAAIDRQRAVGNSVSQTGKEQIPLQPPREASSFSDLGWDDLVQMYKVAQKRGNRQMANGILKAMKSRHPEQYQAALAKGDKARAVFTIPHDELRSDWGYKRDAEECANMSPEQLSQAEEEEIHNIRKFAKYGSTKSYQRRLLAIRDAKEQRGIKPGRVLAFSDK